MGKSEENLDEIFNRAMNFLITGDKEAPLLFESLAKAGHAGGQFYHAMQFYNSSNYLEAEKWLKMAAEQDFVDAMENLGHLYHNGLGVEQDYESAFSWYMMADNLGSGNAAYIIGLYYLQGIGVCKDLMEAMCWFLVAQGRGHEKASQAILDLIEIDKISNPYLIAVESYQSGDYKKARYLFLALAEKGHSLSQFHVGMCHYFVDEKFKAGRWFLLSAEQGNNEAMIMLERCVTELKLEIRS